MFRIYNSVPWTSHPYVLFQHVKVFNKEMIHDIHQVNGQCQLQRTQVLYNSKYQNAKTPKHQNANHGIDHVGKNKQTNTRTHLDEHVPGSNKDFCMLRSAATKDA